MYIWSLSSVFNFYFLLTKGPDGPTSDVLLQVQVPTVSDDICASTYNGIGDNGRFDSNSMMCAGFPEGFCFKKLTFGVIYKLIVKQVELMPAITILAVHFLSEVVNKLFNMASYPGGRVAPKKVFQVNLKFIFYVSLCA